MNMMSVGMKKTAVAFTILGSLLIATTALADPGIPIQIAPPANFGITPSEGAVQQVVANALRLLFIVATIAVLIYLIWGAFQWITSGGDKEAVGNARKRITAALVGLAILALSFLIVFVVGRIVNINILDIRSIPALNDPIQIQATPTPIR